MEELIENEFNYKSSLQLLELKSSVISFFRDLDYIKIDDKNSSIQIRRGSKFKNGFTFNPLKWKSDITINFEEINNIIHIYGSFKINTKKQVVTEKDITLWNQVFENFENLILNGKSDSNFLIKKSKEIRNSNIKLALWILFGAVTGAVISMYPAVKFELPILIPLFVIGGAIFFLIFGLRKRN